MLSLIGLGLAKKDLSFGALDEIKNADELFLETYTAFIPDDYLVFLERQAGRKPVLLERKDLEEDVKQTVTRAKDKNVVILVPGDPLIATTHGIVLNEAKKQRVNFKVVHAPSVFSIAIGESGLDVYKFGPTATIPFWSEKYRPKSFIDTIQKNLRNGQHTLVLLDIDHANGRPMKLSEALEIIEKARSGNKDALLREDTKIIIMANLGREDAIIRYVRIADADQKLFGEFDNKQISLIVPGELSFAELDGLQRATS